MDPRRDDRGREHASSSTQTAPQQPLTSQDHAEQDIPPIHSVSRRSPPRPLTSSTLDKFEDDILVPELHRDNTSRGVHAALPPLPQARHPGADGRQPPRLRPVESHLSAGPRSGIDWIVPVDEKAARNTVGDRLRPTVTMAINERDKYASKAKITGYALNLAIGLQILIGSLITGLSAVTSGKQTALSTTILGGFNTLIAGYLARARGSNEPDLSITRVKDLEQFIRECEAFQLDHGHVTTREFDEQLIGYRRHFEQLLGNANGERKLSPPV